MGENLPKGYASQKNEQDQGLLSATMEISPLPGDSENEFFLTNKIDENQQ
jgi:hypothetical protein